MNISAKLEPVTIDQNQRIDEVVANSRQGLVSWLSSMERLADTVKQNADNAGAANALAQKASKTAVGAGGLMTEVVATMDASHASAKKVVEMTGGTET